MDINFFKSELSKVSPRKILKNSIVIKCPFHVDSSPSCHINIKLGKLPLGVFHCFSCNASGPWNKLADKLHLQKIDEESLKDINEFKTLQAKLKDVQEDFTCHLPKGLTPWKGSWRKSKIPEKLLVQIGAKKWWDSQSEVYRILLPVTNFNNLQGYVGGRLDGDKVTEPKYRNSHGEWAKTTWFGLDYPLLSKKIQSIYNDYPNTIVLVEGPADCLRVLKEGLPCIALLGTNNWDIPKLQILHGLGFTTIVLFMDGDDAGLKATKELNKILKQTFKVINFMLPIDENKYDPDNCPTEFIEQIKSILKNKQTDTINKLKY